MLKIKDNVDLKELEKFGFKYNDKICNYGNFEECHFYQFEFDNWLGYVINIFVNDCEVDDRDTEARVLYFMNFNCSYVESPSYKFPNILYDLITAGLVEKVV